MTEVDKNSFSLDESNNPKESFDVVEEVGDSILDDVQLRSKQLATRTVAFFCFLLVIAIFVGCFWHICRLSNNSSNPRIWSSQRSFL